MNKSNNMKYKVFEYVCYRIYQFYQQNHIKNDLGFSKLMKLLYFISGVDTENHLFDIFRFQAWQYGHMDPDLYDVFSKNKGKFDHFEIDRFSFEWTSSENDIPTIEDPGIKKRVDICVDIMITEHPNTITAGFWNLLFILQNLISYKHMVKYDMCYDDIDKNLMIYEPKVYL